MIYISVRTADGNITMSDLESDLRLLVHGARDPDVLLELLGTFLRRVPFPSPQVGALVNILADASTDPDITAILTLFQIELLLYYSSECDTHVVESKFRALAPLSMMNQLDHGTMTNLSRVKYHDLHTDYQYLFAPDVKELKLMDLVTKKLTVLSLCSSNKLLVREVQMKIYVYYLLCGTDFRKRSVSKYLGDEKVLERDYAAPIQAFRACHSSDALIPLASFENLVEYLETQSMFNAVLRTHKAKFFETFLEGNLSKLVRYYLNIRLERIRAILGTDAVDIEDLVFRMIIGKKFPEGTKIDQMSGVLHFGQPPQKYDDFNAHIKRVCDVVERLAAKSAV